MNDPAIEPAEEALGSPDRGIEGRVVTSGVAVEGDVQVVDTSTTDADLLLTRPNDRSRLGESNPRPTRYEDHCLGYIWL